MTIFHIAKQVGQIEADLKVKSQAYNALKTSLQSMEKKQTGSLMTRNLGDLVKKEHFVLDSEYLTTLLVVVPLNMINDWHAIHDDGPPIALAALHADFGCVAVGNALAEL